MTNNKKKELSLLDYSIAVSQALEEYRDFVLAEKQKYADYLKQELRELNQEKNSLTELFTTPNPQEE